MKKVLKNLEIDIFTNELKEYQKNKIIVFKNLSIGKVEIKNLEYISKIMDMNFINCEIEESNIFEIPIIGQLIFKGCIINNQKFDSGQHLSFTDCSIQNSFITQYIKNISFRMCKGEIEIEKTDDNNVDFQDVLNLVNLPEDFIIKSEYLKTYNLLIDSGIFEPFSVPSCNMFKVSVSIKSEFLISIEKCNWLELTNFKISSIHIENIKKYTLKNCILEDFRFVKGTEEAISISKSVIKSIAGVSNMATNFSIYNNTFENVFPCSYEDFAFVDLTVVKSNWSKILYFLTSCGILKEGNIKKIFGYTILTDSTFEKYLNRMLYVESVTRNERLEKSKK